jgi:hypothetical protein
MDSDADGEGEPSALTMMVARNHLRADVFVSYLSATSVMLKSSHLFASVHALRSLM